MKKESKRCWLLKTDPESYSIGDLRRDKKTAWTGVRNYQARNFLKEMRPGDLALIYHSIAEPIGVWGVAKVVRTAQPDPTAFDKKDSHFDPKATKENPIWYAPDVAFVRMFKEPVTLARLKLDPKLEGMEVLRPGSRLSVAPVSEAHFERVLAIAGK